MCTTIAAARFPLNPLPIPLRSDGRRAYRNGQGVHEHTRANETCVRVRGISSH